MIQPFQWIENDCNYTLVAICDVKDDAIWMETKIKSVDEKDRKALDALAAAYLSLVGADGLSVLVEKYFKNEESDYVDVYAVVGALRFHATEGKKIEPYKVADAMATLLDRPDLADLVIRTWLDSKIGGTSIN